MSNVGIFATILYMTQYIMFLQTVEDTVCVCRQKIFKI